MGSVDKYNWSTKIPTNSLDFVEKLNDIFISFFLYKSTLSLLYYGSLILLDKYWLFWKDKKISLIPSLSNVKVYLLEIDFKIRLQIG